jgi:hypothetical protein
LFSVQPASLAPYTVVISRGDHVLATLNPPQHYRFARWRWQSSPRPVIGKTDSLISQNLLPPYAHSASSGSSPPSMHFAPYTILGLAGVTAYMPQTGERADIGLLTALPSRCCSLRPKRPAPCRGICATRTRARR